ncbi:iron-containing alcohol dehydrogenase [Sphaerochaeta sp. PS]|uniref:iron-containing alcohol dehydrogenase n=1 Tax=Sphaerochaeta sp. PS TaxID=3076336 RepID=UPI0028A4EEE2|nr:iron-containing alcohol dehydrogenase [Sphaerochaeta sp. PS]MDT4762004.1 iron-containing alcohol dehydrogenase [Sphaerochaeta sp. PS]
MTADFTYYTPTKVVFGKDAESQVGSLIKEQQCKKVLVHYGTESAKRSGLLDRITASLQTAGIEHVLLGGVVPNPRLSKVHEGIELGKREGVDFILAVGGGSVIDSAKAIGYGLYHGGEVWDFYSQKRPIEGCLPIAAVLTIAAAGSEMSDSSVITNEDGDLKRGANSVYSRCRFAILNPTLTYTLPTYQTMSGAVDIMMHTIERYFFDGESMYLTDEIAEGLLRTVVHYSLILKENPNDYDGRANLMWASSLSHNGLTGAGNSARGDWAPHQLEHEMGGMFDVAHGAGLSAVWGAWARYVCANRAERFARLGEKVFNVERTGDVLKDALTAIHAFEEFFRSIGMPTNFRELGIEPTDEQIEEMTVKCTFFGKRTLGSVMVLGAKEIHDIYTNAR